MKNSYKFFQNRECEYFPCHKTDKPETFNCLFCYCPLYRKEKCIGAPAYILDGKGQKIRDCSACTIVHRPEMYEKVIEELYRQDFIVSVKVSDIWSDIIHRIAQIASWDQMDEEMIAEHKKVLDAARDDSSQVLAILQPFDPQCLKNGWFEIGREKILCQVLERVDRTLVEQGYLYTFHAPELAKGNDASLLLQYYQEVFQIACIDVVRDWLCDYLQRKHSIHSQRYCSPSFGPGYYGMEYEAAEKILRLIDASAAGVSWKNGAMEPVMSIAGIYLISEKSILNHCPDCESCIGGTGGCKFCRGGENK